MNQKKLLQPLSRWFGFTVIAIASGMPCFAQQETTSKPKLWFSFDNLSFYYYADLYPGVDQPVAGGLNFAQASDRFNNANKACGFSNNGYCFTQIVVPGDQGNKNAPFFGMGSIPASYTVSCWIYVDQADTMLRKIYYG